MSPEGPRVGLLARGPRRKALRRALRADERHVMGWFNGPEFLAVFIVAAWLYTRHATRKIDQAGDGSHDTEG